MLFRCDIPPMCYPSDVIFPFIYYFQITLSFFQLIFPTIMNTGQVGEWGQSIEEDVFCNYLTMLSINNEL